MRTPSGLSRREIRAITHGASQHTFSTRPCVTCGQRAGREVAGVMVCSAACFKRYEARLAEAKRGAKKQRDAYERRLETEPTLECSACGGEGEGEVTFLGETATCHDCRGYGRKLVAHASAYERYVLYEEALRERAACGEKRLEVRAWAEGRHVTATCPYCEQERTMDHADGLWLAPYPDCPHYRETLRGRYGRPAVMVFTRDEGG